LAVDERLRGTGIGRRLLATAEDWASSRGLEQLRIRSRRDRDSAHAAFASMGFVLSKTQRVFTRTRRAEAVLLKNKRIADSGRERYIDERKEGE
jgi:GNAT superfamily N-acetyltransferase